MSIKDTAKSLFGDLLSDKEKEELAVNQEVEEPDVQFIVYFMGEQPDTVWEYHHKPDDGIPYGRLYGFWEDADESGKRNFKEHKSTNLKLMSFEKFMELVPPNRDCTKIFDSEAEFLLELI